MWRRVFLLAGAALLIGLVMRLGVGQITLTIAAVGWRFFVILGLFLGHQMARAAALGQTVPAEARPRFSDLVAVRLSGEAVDYTVFTGPLLAEPVKGWLLTRGGVSIRDAYGGVVADYLVYSFLSAMLAIVGLSALAARVPPGSAIRVVAFSVIGVLAGFLIVAVTAIALRVYLIGGVVRWTSRLPFVGRCVTLDATSVRDFEDRLLALLREQPSRLAAITGLETLAHAFQIAEVYVVLNALGLMYAPSDPFIIEGGVKFTPVAFFFIPGALGAAEGTYVALFTALGLGAAAGFSLGFIRRVRALVIAGVGLLALARLSGEREPGFATKIRSVRDGSAWGQRGSRGPRFKQ
ncbi:MAG: flippase-like domain-containing protein [Acidobacteria bacterium]|nr:flippase-like domain-containing protein [Acidobacteriota bacterium]